MWITEARSPGATKVISRIKISDRAHVVFPYHVAADRLADEDEVERLVSAGTGRRERWELAAQLRRVGVPAVPLESVADHLDHDPGMARRYSVLTHPFGYTMTSQNQYIRPYGQVVPNGRPPNLGEHTDEVLSQLGVSDEVITDLFAGGVLR